MYGAALAAAFLLFCFYLKWQPFMARLELPLFVLGAPLAAYLLDRLRPRWIPALVCLLLVSGARLPAIDNWTRPLKGPHSLLRTARNDNYFSDMGQWNNRASYLEAVDATARSGCRLVGIDISENQLEYPFRRCCGSATRPYGSCTPASLTLRPGMRPAKRPNPVLCCAWIAKTTGESWTFTAPWEPCVPSGDSCCSRAAGRACPARIGIEAEFG